jgi:hypothetical protein
MDDRFEKIEIDKLCVPIKMLHIDFPSKISCRLSPLKGELNVESEI